LKVPDTGGGPAIGGDEELIGRSRRERQERCRQRRSAERHRAVDRHLIVDDDGRRAFDVDFEDRTGGHDEVVVDGDARSVPTMKMRLR
jgi:hypothetical protein